MSPANLSAAGVTRVAERIVKAVSTLEALEGDAPTRTAEEARCVLEIAVAAVAELSLHRHLASLLAPEVKPLDGVAVAALAVALAGALLKEARDNGPAVESGGTHA